MRLVDIQTAFPAILMALIMLALPGQGGRQSHTFAADHRRNGPTYARTVRSTALVERGEGIHRGGRVSRAASRRRIVLRHLLPNCLPPLIVIATVQMAAAIALEATLSYLGIGVPITEPSLGLLIKNGFDYMLSGEYWISFFPGIALVLTIVSINLVADDCATC